MLITLSSDNLSKNRTSSQVCHGRFLAESEGGVFSFMFRIKNRIKKQTSWRSKRQGPQLSLIMCNVFNFMRKML